MKMTTHSTWVAAVEPASMFIAGLAIIGVMLVVRATRRRAMRSKAQSAKTPPVRERYAELSRESKAARALGNVMGEMDELSRQIHGRLDTKIAKLETIIRDADERIASLTQLQEKQPTKAGSFDVTLGSEAPLDLKESGAKSNPPNSGSRNSPLASDAHAAIHALADRGRTPEQIASDVARPVGEIELILSLRHASGSSSPI